MPLLPFVLVWIASWAACRFWLSRWWRPYWSGLRYRGGAVESAPFVATLVAFAAETAWLVLS